MKPLHYDSIAGLNSPEDMNFSLSISLALLILCSSCGKVSADQSQATTPSSAKASLKPTPASAQQNASDHQSAQEAVPLAIGPSFDCAKARSIPEKLVCRDAELSAADIQLASIYRRAKEAASDKNAFKEQTRRAWAWREANCKDKACMVTWYADREKELTAQLPSIAATSCFRYEPSKTALTGTLVSITFPGPPNYESVANGDEAESGFYLQLPGPICADGGENDEMAYPQKDVKLVQLVLTSDREYAALRPYLGTTVTLAGTMFAAHTGHHHAPLLLQHVARQ